MGLANNRFFNAPFYERKVPVLAFVNFFVDIFTNSTLIVPIVAWLLAQILKTLINAAVNKTFNLSRLVGDGGMPSAHSATVMSLAVVAGYNAGFDSALFALAMIFAVVVMHDALGVRRETGKQAVSIMQMVEIINNYIVEKDEEIKVEKLKVLVGHTPLQVVAGAILGTVVAVLYIVIFPVLLGVG